MQQHGQETTQGQQQKQMLKQPQQQQHPPINGDAIIDLEMKKKVIQLAKEWPTYFMRFFPTDQQNQLFGISHKEIAVVKLLVREDGRKNTLKMMQSHKLSTIQSVRQFKANQMHVAIKQNTTSTTGSAAAGAAAAAGGKSAVAARVGGSMSAAGVKILIVNSVFAPLIERMVSAFCIEKEAQPRLVKM